jgi:hypothetical protein
MARDEMIRLRNLGGQLVEGGGLAASIVASAKNVAMSQTA